MFHFKVTCTVYNDHMDTEAHEEFGVDLPGGKNHENIINALAEGQPHMAGLAAQCAKQAIWKAAHKRQTEYNEKMEAEAKCKMEATPPLAVVEPDGE